MTNRAVILFAVLVFICGLAVVDVCIADPPESSGMGHYTITGAADYPMLQDSLSSFKWVLGGGISAILGLLLVIWNSLNTRIGKERAEDKNNLDKIFALLQNLCESKHKAIDTECENLWTELGNCCPRAKK